MNYNSTINIESESGLSLESWTFYFDGPKIRLCRFYIGERPSRRHGWRKVKLWDNYDKRNNFNISEKPEIPENIKELVLEKFIDDVEFI